MVDQEKDLFIKKKLQQDDLISENANKIFDGFMMGEYSINQNNEDNLNIQQESDQKNTQSVEQNTQQGQKQKYSRKKKIVSLVASILVIFVATNCFAAAMGYNNIFFIIRNLINHEDIFVSGKDNIFTDRDITISYESIQVSNGVFIQINRFVTKDNKATLHIAYQQLEQHDNLSEIVVTDEQDKQIGRADISQFSNNGYDVEYLDIRLNQFKENMNILIVKVMSEGKEVSKLKIDISTRTIDVLSNGISYELTKLSETELKQILSKYVMVNYYDDVISRGTPQASKDDYIMAFMIDNATFDYSVDTTNVARVLNEMYGRDINLPVQLNARISNIAKLDTNTNKYNGRSDDEHPYGYCINVSDIKFENGIYTVTFSYCYLAEDGDTLSNKISRANLYETTLQFKVNNNFKYYRYQIQNVNNITSQLVKEANYNEIIEAENNY